MVDCIISFKLLTFDKIAFYCQVHFRAEQPLPKGRCHDKMLSNHIKGK